MSSCNKLVTFTYSPATCPTRTSKIVENNGSKSFKTTLSPDSTVFDCLYNRQGKIKLIYVKQLNYILTRQEVVETYSNVQQLYVVCPASCAVINNVYYLAQWMESLQSLNFGHSSICDEAEEQSSPAVSIEAVRPLRVTHLKLWVDPARYGINADTNTDIPIQRMEFVLFKATHLLPELNMAELSLPSRVDSTTFFQRFPGLKDQVQYISAPSHEACSDTMAAKVPPPPTIGKLERSRKASSDSGLTSSPNEIPYIDLTDNDDNENVAISTSILNRGQDGSGNNERRDGSTIWIPNARHHRGNQP